MSRRRYRRTGLGTGLGSCGASVEGVVIGIAFLGLVRRLAQSSGASDSQRPIAFAARFRTSKPGGQTDLAVRQRRSCRHHGGCNGGEVVVYRLPDHGESARVRQGSRCRPCDDTLRLCRPAHLSAMGNVTRSLSPPMYAATYEAWAARPIRHCATRGCPPASTRRWERLLARSHHDVPTPGFYLPMCGVRS